MHKILIVEDEQNLVKIYTTRFTSEGWEVISTTTGASIDDIVEKIKSYLSQTNS